MYTIKIERKETIKLKVKEKERQKNKKIYIRE